MSDHDTNHHDLKPVELSCEQLTHVCGGALPAIRTWLYIERDGYYGFGTPSWAVDAAIKVEYEVESI